MIYLVFLKNVSVSQILWILPKLENPTVLESVITERNKVYAIIEIKMIF